MAAGTLGGLISGAAVDRALGWTPGRSAPALRRLVAAGLLLTHHVDGYAFAAPALRQVAVERLPRALRTVFQRRAASVPHLDTVHRDTNPPAGTVNGSAARSAEIVRLDTVGARTGRLDAVFAALGSAGPGRATGTTAARPGNPTPTMAAPPAASSPGANRTAGPRRLRAVASAGDVPPTPATAVSRPPRGAGVGPLRDIGRAAAPIRPTPPSSAGHWTLADAGTPPGVVRASPRPPLIRLDGLPASA